MRLFFPSPPCDFTSVLEAAIMSTTKILTAATLLASQASAALMHNALAVTPQMGWDNWNGIIRALD